MIHPNRSLEESSYKNYVDYKGLAKIFQRGRILATGLETILVICLPSVYVPRTCPKLN